MSDHWSRLEVEAAVSDYFDMLVMELRGENVNKAEHNRHLQKLLNRRTKGSIERKHQNTSAVLIEFGYPYINGYKPLRNYQDLLRDVIEERLEIAAKSGLDELIGKLVTDEAASPANMSDLHSIEVDAPNRDADDYKLREKAMWQPRIHRRNYLETEARNQSLGLAGEQLVMNFEHERLWRAGLRHYAERIEHSSKTEGDHLGFDIRSFEADGRERLIEVKTTRFGVSTPFFVSTNEIRVSKEHADEYHLYRVFNFERNPRLFRLPGAIEKSCTLSATEFRAVPW